VAQKAKLEVVEAPRGIDTSTLEEPFRDMFNELVQEVVAFRGAATKADLTLILSAAQAAQGESEARAFAREAKAMLDSDLYIKFTKLAESQIRSKSAALGCLGLSGDRRGASAAKRAAHAAEAGSAVVADGKKTTNRWK